MAGAAVRVNAIAAAGATTPRHLRIAADADAGRTDSGRAGLRSRPGRNHRDRRSGWLDRGAACHSIDLIVEVTGTIESAAQLALAAFKHGKHVVLVNAELDSLLGPILKAKADQAGVVITNTDGDEPGVELRKPR